MFQTNIPKNLIMTNSYLRQRNLLAASLDKGARDLCNEMQNIQKQINEYTLFKKVSENRKKLVKCQ